MKKNMGNTDRAVRLVIAAVLIGLYFSEVLVGTVGIIALVVGVVFTLTSFVGFCPLYKPLGLNTCKRTGE
ncbi:DUF2892 domain-containing protein [Algoriphagus kandeliae]|uniref:DUF2892 domain-containing protein n=1 Tax=Algoriphagus kandeliae TaxID=2562278 RepID=A0A4Y9QLA7_9BACT|nr:DUF2892 domain-containing protein [Algoriphagus kandeliae]TFV92362.1 DUF2892 domain-containing protein [Algoriphagus kandeliae]